MSDKKNSKDEEDKSKKSNNKDEDLRDDREYIKEVINGRAYSARQSILDEMIVPADDNISMEDRAKGAITGNHSPVPVVEKLLDAKLLLLEELSSTILANQAVIMEALANIQNKLNLEFQTKEAQSEYEKLLSAYMDKGY